MSAVVTEKKLKVVGTRPDRPEGVPKVTGTAQYRCGLEFAGHVMG